MRKLVLLTAILMAALIASAPAMAEEILSAEPETTVGGGFGKASEAPPQKTPEAPPEPPAAPPEPPPAPAPLPDVVADEIVEDNLGFDDGVSEDTVVPPATDTGSLQDTGAPNAGSPDAGSDADQSEEDPIVEDTSDDGDAAAEEADEDSGDRKGDDEVKASGDSKSSGKGDNNAKGSGKSDDDDKGSGKGNDKGSGKNDDDGVEQDSDQDADSGDVDQDVDIVNTGDNVNMCIGIIQAVNTGNIQDSDQIALKDSEAEEVELEDGSSITVTPQLVIDCRQIIYQIVTGEDSDGSKDKVSKTGSSKLAKTKIDLKSTYFRNSSAGSSSARNNSAQQVRTGGSGTRVISNRADVKAAQQNKAPRRALPRTGGLPISYAAVLGLCVGAPLIGGGLLLRRISR